MIDFERLVDRFLEEELSAAEHGQLNNLLATDGALRSEFLQRVALHRAVRSQLMSRHALAVSGDIAPVATSPRAVVVEPADVALSKGQHVWGTVRDFANNYITLSLLISAITMAIIILSMGLMRPGNNPGGSGDQTPSTEFVAEISGTHQVTFDAASDGNLKNRSLFAGESIILKSGLAEVVFEDGAMVLLEGPATLRLDSAGGGALRQGKLAANVPKRAIGFTIVTPTATIVDLGTEFGVRVADDGSTDATVMNGKINVKLTSAKAENNQPLLLSAGQSVRVDSSDHTLLATTSPSNVAFISRLSDVTGVAPSKPGTMLIVRNPLSISASSVFDSRYPVDALFDAEVSPDDVGSNRQMGNQYAGSGVGPHSVYMDFGENIVANGFVYSQRVGSDPMLDKVTSIAFFFSDTDLAGVDLSSLVPDATIEITNTSDAVLTAYEFEATLSARYVAMRITGRVSDLPTNPGGAEFRLTYTEPAATSRQEIAVP